MLLGILLHAAITYMDRRMDGLLWPIDDQPRQFGFDVLFWWIHGWRIPLFFVMAGFFAAMLARRRGPVGFIRHRIQRILLPVAIASVTLLPMMYYLWGWGWQLEGRATFREIWRANFDDEFIDDHFFGPAHLWFLNYLVVFSFVYWLILRLRGAQAGGDEPTLPVPAQRCLTSALRPVWFAIPTFAFLAIDPGFFLAYHHLVPLTGKAWLYEVAQLSFQGYFFVVGVYLFRLHRNIDALKRYAWLYLLLAHLLFVGCVWLIGRSFAMRDAGDGIDLPTRLGLAAGVALFCWLMIWGLTGLGLTVLARPRVWLRWLSDSAYWVYLVHLPIVVVLMIVMRHWPIGPWPRFLLIVAVTSALTLVSYQYAVRFTVIGRWLNGPRARPGDASH